MEFYNIWMSAKGFQENNLSEGSLSIGFVPKCIEYLFHRQRFIGSPIHSFPDNAVRAFAQALFSYKDTEIIAIIIVIKFKNRKK